MKQKTLKSLTCTDYYNVFTCFAVKNVTRQDCSIPIIDKQMWNVFLIVYTLYDTSESEINLFTLQWSVCGSRLISCFTFKRQGQRKQFWPGLGRFFLSLAALHSYRLFPRREAGALLNFNIVFNEILAYSMSWEVCQ